MTNTIAGYCLLSAPSDQVKPFTIITSSNGVDAQVKGFKLTDMFTKSNAGLPTVKKNGNMSGTVNKMLSIDLAVDSNLTLLEELLRFLKLSVSFKLQKNKTLRLHMIEPKIDTVNDFQLDAFINNANVSTLSPTYTEALENDELYVVSSILKCRKYSLEYVDSNNTKSGLEAAVPLAGKLGAGVSTNKVSNDTISSEGTDYITIGVKAYQIIYYQDENGKVSFRIRQDEKLKTMKGDEDFPGKLLHAEKVVITNS